MKRSSPQKKFGMGYVKMHGFHGNLLYDSVCLPSVHQHFQTSPPLKPLHQFNSFYYGYSLGRGNENLFKWSWSHYQDGRHAHIW